MAERIATGEIKIDLDDSEAIAGLRKLDREFDRTMDKIEREHATATVEADIAPLEDSIANAKRQLKILAAQEAEVEIDGDDSGFQEKVAATRAEIKRLEAKKATIELDVKGEEKVRKVEQALHDARMRQIKAADQAQERAARDQQQRVNREARTSASLHKQQMGEMRAAENEARRIDKEKSDRALKVANLQKQYAKSVRDFERQSFRRKPLGREARVEVELDQNLAKEKMLAIKRELNLLGGHPPVEIKIDVDRKGRALEWVRNVGDAFTDLPNKLQGIRVALGPISGGIGTLMTAMIALLPVIAALIGAVGALIAVAGSAALGLGALALGLTGGAIPAFAGLILVMKPVIAQLQNAHKAQTKYNDAVTKYGKDSKQAKTAMEQFKRILGGVDDSTAKAFLNAGKLSKQWTELTKPATAAVFEAIGASRKTAPRDLGTFATGTNRVVTALTNGWERWMRGLRGSEAREILGNLLGNFAKFVGPVMDGLGDIFTWLSRIADIASDFLPDIGKGFADWAQGLADSAKDGDHVRDVLDNMMDSLKSVGHLFTASAGLIEAFFAGGVDEGQNLAEDLADTFDKWADILKSPEGRESLKDFFHGAVEDAKDIAGALKDIATNLYEIEQAARKIIAPIKDVWDFLNMDSPQWLIDFQNWQAGNVTATLAGLSTAFNAVKGAATAAFNWIIGAANSVGGAISSLAGKIAGVARSIGNIASKAVKIGINFAGGGIDKAKSAISSVTKLGGQAVKIGFSFASGAVNAAIRLVNRLLGLGGSIVRIGASFASGVINAGISVVRRLLGLGGSVVRIGASFASGVIQGAIGLVRRLLAFAGRVVRIGTSVALGPINAALGVLRQVASFAGRVITLHINIPTPHIPKIPFLNKAKGQSAGTDAGMAMVGEGGGPEIIGNRRTGMARVASRAQFTMLDKDDYVIPTEAAQRSRGEMFARDFGRDVGMAGIGLRELANMMKIPGFKAGKKPQPPHKPGRVNRAYAKKDINKKVIKNPGAYSEINAVNTLKQAELDQRARIGLKEGSMDEPDSFIDKVGEDQFGNDIYQINQGRINEWVGKLGELAKMQRDLITIIKQLATAVQKAVNAVKRARKRAGDNIEHLNELEKRERGIIGGHGSKKGKEAAKERLKYYEAEDKRQDKIRQDAAESEDDLKSEQQFAGGVGKPGAYGERYEQALQEYNETMADIAGVQGKAQGQMPEAPEPPAAPEVDPFAGFNLRGSALTAEAALTAIGQGTRTPQEIIADQIANDQGIINFAKSMLTDADLSNDAAAYGAITSAAGDILNLQGSLPNIANETNILSGARGDISKSFGSNAIISGALQPSYATPGTVGTSPTGQYPAGGTGNIINVTNNYQTQPTDPHTWSRNLLFELQAAS